MRHQILPKHQTKGPKLGPEGPLIRYQIMVPKSLHAWLNNKGPKFVRNELLKIKEN